MKSTKERIFGKNLEQTIVTFDWVDEEYVIMVNTRSHAFKNISKNINYNSFNNKNSTIVQKKPWVNANLDLYKSETNASQQHLASSSYP